MKYKSKIDHWIRIILLGSIFMFVPIMMTVPSEEIPYLVGVMLLMIVIIVPLFYISYELTDDALIVRIYIFRQTIKYDNIKSIRKCSNWINSGTAMSKDRIEIKQYNKSWITGTSYISPEQRDDFYDELKRNCRNLEGISNTIDFTE